VGVSLLWFRRDLRLHDSPALLDAAADGRPVAPVFVVDPALWGPAGLARRAYLARSLRSLDADLGGRLHVLQGDPVAEVVEAARRLGAESVHVSADFGPYGAQRDARVEAALADVGIDLVRSGSAYAVAPGRVVKADGTPYRVFTPFWKALRAAAAPPAPIAAPTRAMASTTEVMSRCSFWMIWIAWGMASSSYDRALRPRTRARALPEPN